MRRALRLLAPIVAVTLGLTFALSGCGSDDPVATTPGDTTPPGLVSQSPLGGAVGVDLDASVSVTFSEAIAAASVTASSFTLTGPAGAVVGTTSVTGATVTFDPAAPLAASTSYTALLTTEITDRAGNALSAPLVWSFTTGEITAPTVDGTIPAADATDVSIDATLEVTFSEPLNPATVSDATFQLSGPSGDVTGVVSVAGVVVSFDPVSALEAETTYTATLATEITDVAGNALEAPFTWSFTTIETTPPIVISTFPDAGATDVEFDVAIEAIFSEPIDRATLTASSFTLSRAGAQVDGTLDFFSDTIPIFTPSTPLEPNVEYTVQLTTAITDDAGNPLESDFTWTFVTKLIDPDFYYRLTNEFVGPDQSLGSVSETGTEAACFLGGTGPLSDQLWKFTQDGSFWRIQNEVWGDARSLDGADGFDPASMENPSGAPQQRWTVIRLDDTAVRLQNDAFGSGKSLDFFVAGNDTAYAFMGDTDTRPAFQAQNWKLEKVGPIGGPFTGRVLVQRVSGLNRQGFNDEQSLINHALLNGSPDRFMILTQRRLPPGCCAQDNPNPAGLFYGGENHLILNLTTATLPLQAGFNVLLPSDDDVRFIHTADSGNVTEFATFLDHPSLNDNPEAMVFVTQLLKTPSGPEVSNPNVVGVAYENGSHIILNQALANIPLGASFNVMVVSPGPNAFVHTNDVVSANGADSYMDHPSLNGNPDAVVTITQRWNRPGETEGVFSTNPMGVSYRPSRGQHYILSEVFADIPPGASFNVLVGTGSQD